MEPVTLYTAKTDKESWRAIGGHVTHFHVVVVALSLVMTLGAWHFSVKQVESRSETRFFAARDRALGLIHDRLQKYEDALWAGVATIESQGGDIPLEEWQVFAGTLRIDERYPGVNGIGVIHSVRPENRDEYLAARTQERPEFRMFPDHDQDVLLPISFIEPAGPNAEAIGLDVAHEAHRRIAAEASRDIGTAQITGPITLVQDAGHTPGFLFYAPIYAAPKPQTLQERQEQFIGAVYAPFVTRKLMEGLLAKELRQVRFSISDSGQSIYDEHAQPDPLLDPIPMFSDVATLNLYGRNWVVDIRSNLAFRSGNTYTQPTLILIGGLMIEFLIVALLLLMGRANERAVAYAGRVTADLRREKEKLARSNAELEQFAYIASHDLKTPIRGIGVLTDIIKEDLDGYLASSDANPDVAVNLEYIEERVSRMNSLIHGVLEFSRTGRTEVSTGSLDLIQMIEDMRSDFGLGQDQLFLNGSVDVVSVDTGNFRRVLENLVSNAVKYHDNFAALEISISVVVEGEDFHVSVSDNGPGIDQKFHAKIFDVFQTLRQGEEEESTGVGLAIVKKAVEHHGGAVQLSSTLGKGSIFRFCWPIDARSDAGFQIRGAA